MATIKSLRVFLLLLVSLHFMAGGVVASKSGELSEVIVESIEKAFPGCKITETEKEKWKGKVVTEVELVASDGVRYEVYVSDDGTIQKIEEEESWGWFSK